MKKLLNILFSRMTVIGVLILVQAAVLVSFILTLSEHFVYIYAAFLLLSISMVLWLVNKNDNPSVKLPWVIVIMLVPVFGGLFYLFFGATRLPKKIWRRMNELSKRVECLYPKNTKELDEIRIQDVRIASQCEYIQRQTHMPVYQNTQTLYLPLGEIKFEALKRELEQAKYFIFMEYFIIEQGKMWDPILEILTRKAAQGVDVRVIYDDVGCLQTLPMNYNKKLEGLGIHCAVFNPFHPTLSTFLQNRDHRKIAVIDGHTGFTGGINLADEYINAYPKHGHWKDSAIWMRGEAVWSFTLMFLEAWDFCTGDNTDYEQYRPEHYQVEPFVSDGYIQPYGDSPLDYEYVGESVYLNIINQATRYVYINSPYFIVDNELVTAITLAAKRGVDIKLVMPHVADKWYVHMVTRSYYRQLVQAGVQVYEYTPGFVHAKTFVADDQVATVGTINMDYRSLYHHYECGAWMYAGSCITQVRDDFLKTLDICGQVTMADCDKVPMVTRFMRGCIKILAPLM